MQRLTEALSAADRALSAQQREVDELVTSRERARDAVSRLVASLPVPIVTTGVDGVVELCNAAASSLLVVPAPALVSTPVHAFVVAEDRPLARSLLSRAGREGTAAAPLRLQPREGSVREVHAAVSAWPTAQGDPRLVVVLAPAEPVDAAEPPARAPGGGVEADALRSLARLVELAVGGSSGHQLLGALAAAATASVPGASSASASTGDPAQPADSAADSAQAQAVDGAQWAADEGPASTAHSTGRPVWSSDLSADDRWPRLARRAAGLDAGSAVAVPLRDGERVVGVVSTYGPSGRRPEVERAVAFAEAASAVLGAARRTADLAAEVENLKLAMQSRAAIEQAKGAVASRLDCTVEEAFGAMVVMSQDRNVKVRDIGLLLAASPGDRSLDEPLRAALERAQQRTAARPRA